MLRFQRRDSPKPLSTHEKTSAPKQAQISRGFSGRESQRGDARLWRSCEGIEPSRPVRYVYPYPCPMRFAPPWRKGGRPNTNILYIIHQKPPSVNSQFFFVERFVGSVGDAAPRLVRHSRSHKRPTTPPPERSPARNHVTLCRIPLRGSREEEALPDSPRHPAMLLSSMRLASHSMSGSSRPSRSASGRTTK